MSSPVCPPIPWQPIYINELVFLLTVGTSHLDYCSPSESTTVKGKGSVYLSAHAKVEIVPGRRGA